MATFIVLFVCLHLLPSPTINESEKRYTAVSESAIQSTRGSESETLFTGRSKSGMKSNGSSESETQSTEGRSFSTHTGHLSDSETMKKPHGSLTTTVSEIEHNLRDLSSSISAEIFSMATEEKTMETIPRTHETFISTTALKLMISTSVKAKSADSDSASTATPGVSMTTDQLQESISDPVTKETSMGNCS